MQYFSDDWFRSEWQKLGFHYELNHEAKRWEITGSLKGLKAFSLAIRTYATDSDNDWVSCHCNLGPYDYLEIGTWNVPVIDDHWIAGPLESLIQLAESIDAWLEGAQPGMALLAGAQFSSGSPYELQINLMDPQFDPASCDDSLAKPDGELR